jgi:hypothetical protein
MNKYYSVWPDGANFRSVKGIRRDGDIKNMFSESTLQQIPELRFAPITFEEDLEEELEADPENGQDLVDARFSRGYGDCVFVWPSIGPVLLLSENGFDSLESQARQDGLFKPVEFDGKVFFAFFCTTVIKCLDPLSEISFLSSGVPTQVQKYRLTNDVDKANLFFRIPWDDGRLLPELFGTEKLKNLIDLNSLTGFRLKELPQLMAN